MGSKGLSFGSNERKPVISLLFSKVWSIAQRVSMTKFSFGLKESVGVIIFGPELPKIQKAAGIPFLPQAPMQIPIPNSGPCMRFRTKPVFLVCPVY